MQQWESQITPEDFCLSDKEVRIATGLGISTDAAILEKVRQRQKYLTVNLNANSAYKDTHGSVRLHSLVGLTHCPIYLDDVFWSPRDNRYKFKGSKNLDHLDKDKANNSVHNLHWTTSFQNTVMVDWTIEEKIAFYADDREILMKDDRNSVLCNVVSDYNQ